MAKDKESFIRYLAKMTPKEINELIEEKGTKPKKPNLFVYVGEKLQTK